MRLDKRSRISSSSAEKKQTADWRTVSWLTTTSSVSLRSNWQTASPSPSTRDRQKTPSWACWVSTWPRPSKGRPTWGKSSAGTSASSRSSKAPGHPRSGRWWPSRSQLKHSNSQTSLTTVKRLKKGIRWGLTLESSSARKLCRLLFMKMRIKKTNM